mgnify:CR=1 FL=1
MSNIVIIGSGPAGVSAALYTARAGVDTTVLTRGPGALDRAELIQNYYGFAAPISGAELERQGIEGAKAVGVKFVTTEAVGLTYTDKLTVETLDGDYPADAVVLATGASRATPRIPGLAGLEGHGVSYCATCDAFFYRGKDVAVVGSGEYALHEVQVLLPVAASVTLLLNGAPLAAEFPPEVTVRPEKIDAILGEQKVTGVQLSGGDVVELSLLKLMLSGANTLILDEPTNHLDIDAKEVVEDALLDFEGTLIIVSHDRYLLQKLPTRIFELTTDGIVEYKGRFDYYLQKKEERKAAESSVEESKSTPAGELSAEEERKLRKEQEAEKRRQERRIKELEGIIEDLEARIQKTEEILCAPENMSNVELLQEKGELLEKYKAELEVQYEEWMELQYIEQKILCRIHHDVDVPVHKLLHDLLVYVRWK